MLKWLALSVAGFVLLILLVLPLIVHASSGIK